ncbi:uncharacterized protein K02A2.6-like [Cydia fagiglandana]|uniref:uncharacterized protein K02A2.6-like n=1 Tax=Cydia fagiglandana TaxID=1458189 RepID=UPI002FEE33FE
MEKLNVIEKIEKPTDWVNSIVVVEKANGTLRVCLDPRSLNEAIKRPHYTFPTFNDLRSNIAGATVFSKLDASSGFWTIPLDEESSDLCTFNTPFGRYKFLRLPFGINSSSEIFHRTMVQLFGDLPGVQIFIDDLLVFGKTQAEHDERLANLLKRAQEVNIKFNRSKCQFNMSEVYYVGHMFNKDGISPDKSKIKAITEMPSPTNVKELQRFLGMVNYLGQYIPNLAEETSILRDLVKKENIWQWSESHEKQFGKLKSLICKAPVLTHFDLKKPIRMSVDASKSAVGAVIFHGRNPIAYASKSLTRSQENYAQIEKELFAILFGAKKFHQYLYGNTVHVETDHQPLVTLFKKPLAEVPARLQRMMIALQAYHLVVSYTKGSEMYISDTLSRAPVQDESNCEFNFNDLEKDVEIHVNLLTSHLAITKDKLNKILEHTNKDESLQKLKLYFKNGWPNSKKEIDPIVSPYWNIRDEIHVINNLVFKGQSVVIPMSLRSEMLSILHEGHLGIEKTKGQARGTVYWPNINSDIESKIKQCEYCLMFMNNKPKDPMMSHEQPIYPWEKVAADLFDYKSKKYLLVVDSYSNYIEVAHLQKGSDSNAVITNLKSIFARHGVPLQLLTDNGPPFNSQAFKAFSINWEFEHITSSPYLPRSNGLAEVSVRIVKNIFKKCDESGTDPYIGLLQYRNSPRGNLSSPAQLLMSRQLRTKLPAKATVLKPKVVNFKEHLEHKKVNLDKTRSYYNQHARMSLPLNDNDYVYFKKKPTDNNWHKGRIVSKADHPRSYIIKDSDNVLYRRNQQHIYRPQNSGCVTRTNIRDFENNDDNYDSYPFESDSECISINNTNDHENNNHDTYAFNSDQNQHSFLCSTPNANSSKSQHSFHSSTPNCAPNSPNIPSCANSPNIPNIPITDTVIRRVPTGNYTTRTGRQVIKPKRLDL